MNKVFFAITALAISMIAPMGLLFAGGPEVPGEPPVGGGYGMGSECHADANKWTCNRSQCWLSYFEDMPGAGMPGNRNGIMHTYPGTVVSVSQVSKRFAEEKTPPLVCKPNNPKEVVGTPCDRQYVLDRCRE
jgi:hypothetical protein